MKGEDSLRGGRSEPMRQRSPSGGKNGHALEEQDKREEIKRGWFRFEMMRMLCVIFIACMSIFLKEETMPTRPLPSHYTQIGTLVTQRKNATTQNITTLLSVPYYVYESLIWSDMTFQGENLTELLALEPLKQSEDYWFMQAALKHPMRVMDPDQAQLFVVPALMNVASDGVALSKQGLNPREYGACNGALCNDQLIEQVEVILSDSPYYRRSNGNDHIMVLSSWYSNHHPQIMESAFFRNLNLIQFEDHILAPNRTTFPSIDVGNPCPAENKTRDFVTIGKRRNGMRLKSRGDLCDWLGKSSYSTGVCGSGVQCPALAQSRYGFHVPGDAGGSNHLIDTLLSGTVPIFTSDEQYAILPNWIDWKLLSVQVNMTTKDEFTIGLEHILNSTDYAMKSRHVLANRDLLDWRTGVAFDVYMFMFQRELLPGTVEAGKMFNPYNFSALKI